jgi:tripartite-type tricarboxylate transporter receptor subunit TctC
VQQFCKIKRCIPTAAFLCAEFLSIVSAGVVHADSVADFYRGRTVTILVGYEAASGYTILARLLAHAISDAIPGNPTVVIQNMPGAGSLKAAGYLYNVAPKDGTMIGTVGRTIPLVPLLNSGNTNFDALKFNWLGSASKNVMVGASWYTSPVKTFDDARTHELIVGAPSANSEAYQIPTLYNATMGTKFKVITGYPQPQIAYGMERGELQGQMQWSLDALLATHSDWIKSGKINLLVQTGFDKDRRLPDVPLAIDYARTPADRQLIKLIFTMYEIARPFVAPPGVPADRLQALRAAFMHAIQNQEFVAAADRAKIDIVRPASAEQVLAFIHNAYQAPSSVLTRAKELFAAN